MANTLSIVIPMYNEAETIVKVLEKVRTVKLDYNIEKEVIIVNDDSTDESKMNVLAYRERFPEFKVKYFEHSENQGKGAALHTGFRNSSGDIVVIQDADSEYNPKEYNTLLEPILNGDADVVYGSRFMGGNPHRVLFFWHTVGNKFLTLLSNMMTNLNLTDMETCYKMFKKDVLNSLKLEEKRFGFEPEVTAKVARIPNVRIFEVGISYYGRSYKEGKKITWKDGFRAIYCILKYGLVTNNRSKALIPNETQKEIYY